MTDEQVGTKVLDEGEVWSFLRRVLSQGGDIQLDYQAGKYKRYYEEYSARLDCAARERAEKFMVLLAAALAARERAVWEEADKFFDVLQDEQNPLTAGQLIFNFQEYCRQQAEQQNGK